MPGATRTLTALAAALTAAVAAAGHAAGTEPKCQLTGKPVPLEGLAEASGVAASARTPGIFWVHNDSGDPTLLAVDRKGAIVGRVRVAGAAVDDWEDIATGPCPQGSCLYIGDIGDNDGRRKHVTVYRVAEPSPDATTAAAEAFHASFPDGPADAESLFVTKDASVFLITKGDPGPVALYRFPKPLAAAGPAQLERVGQPLAGKVNSGDRPTAADASRDGQWVAVRTTDWVAFFRATDLVGGNWREVSRLDLTALRERRGEGVTFDGTDALVLLGEAGGPLRGGAGTFARLPCTFDAAR